eukprot:s3347_g17.t1
MFCCGKNSKVEEPQRQRHAPHKGGHTLNATVLGPRRARDFGTGPTGQRLGGASEASESQQSRQQKRLAALEAIEKRQVVPGISQARQAELSEQRQREELLGRITEQYYRLGDEMPMGLKLASLDQLKKHLAVVRERKAFNLASEWNVDEVSSFSHMRLSFVEFLAALGAVVYLKETYVPDEFADLLEEFILDQLKPVVLEYRARTGKGDEIEGLLTHKTLRKVCEQIFRSADEDSDETLSALEFGNALRDPKTKELFKGKLGIRTQKEFHISQIMEVFGALDEDGSGELNFAEVLHGISALLKMEQTEPRIKAFLKKARPGNGELGVGMASWPDAMLGFRSEGTGVLSAYARCLRLVWHGPLLCSNPILQFVDGLDPWMVCLATLLTRFGLQTEQRVQGMEEQQQATLYEIKIAIERSPKVQKVEPQSAHP